MTIPVLSRMVMGLALFGFLAGSLAAFSRPQSAETHPAGSGTPSNAPDEPFIGEFSLEAALRFSQKTADDWARDRNCVTCHTNGLHLISASRLAPKSTGNRRTREYAAEYLKRYVVDHTPPSRQHGSVEGKVATACFLALSDMATNGQLSSITRKGIDHLWTLQEEDGSWSQWLKCGWPPYESDDHFGVTLVALTMSRLPSSEISSKAATNGISRLKNWLKSHPPEHLHHKGMLTWIACEWKDFIPKDELKSWQSELLSTQRPDGGWRLVDLGDSEWKRPDDVVSDLPSDAYATAFSVFTLRNGGLSANHPSIAKGLQWLRSQQRRGGGWFTRSPRRDGHHFISHAATHFALLAFRSCESKLPAPVKSDR